MKNIKLNDLLFVVVLGFIAATLTGIAVGTINYVMFTLIGISLNIFYFFGAYFIASSIRRQYERSTLAYQIIAVILTIHGYFFSYVVFNVFRVGIENTGFVIKLFYSFRYMIAFFNPVSIFTSGFSGIIEYLFIFIFCYIAFTKTK